MTILLGLTNGLNSLNNYIHLTNDILFCAMGIPRVDSTLCVVPPDAFLWVIGGHGRRVVERDGRHFIGVDLLDLKNNGLSS